MEVVEKPKLKEDLEGKTIGFRKATDKARIPHSPHSPGDRRRAVDPIRIGDQGDEGGEEEKHCGRRR